VRGAFRSTAALVHEFLLRGPAGSARARGAEVGIAVGPDDSTTFCVLDGEAEILGAGAGERLVSGRQITLSPTGQIGTAGPVSRRLDLTLSRPQPGFVAGAEAVQVLGRTAPGALVLVNGRPAAVDVAGQFRAEARVAPGKQILVVALDAAGNRARVVAVARSDVVPPHLSLDVP